MFDFLYFDVLCKYSNKIRYKTIASNKIVTKMHKKRSNQRKLTDLLKMLIDCFTDILSSFVLLFFDWFCTGSGY